MILPQSLHALEPTGDDSDDHTPPRSNCLTTARAKRAGVRSPHLNQFQNVKKHLESPLKSSRVYLNETDIH